MRIKIFFANIVLIITALSCLSACDKKQPTSKKNNTHTIVATSKTPTKQLFFSGTLAPISTHAVVSSVGGIVSSIDFTYGERIQKDQQLLVINSKPLSDDYRKAVSDFLTKKQAYETGITTFKGTQALYKAGIVAKSEYISGKTQFDNTYLDYLQSEYALQKVLKTANVSSEKIESLSLDDTKKVNEILERHFRNVKVIAPTGGVALYPIEKSGSNSSDSSGKLTVGSSIKEGQLLLTIGDLSGLSATFNVSEVDVNSIQKNMSVKVTGDAFPGATLNGVVTSVSAQANQGSGSSGLSMFAVKISIPSVPADVMKKIRVGMTAKFEIDIHSTSQIMLPINAVTQKNGMSVVTIIDSAGKEKTVSVTTGETTPTSVVIVSGVEAGQKVVVHD